MAELLTGQVLFPGTDRILSHQLILTSLGGHMTCRLGSHDLLLGVT